MSIIYLAFSKPAVSWVLNLHCWSYRLPWSLHVAGVKEAIRFPLLGLNCCSDIIETAESRGEHRVWRAKQGISNCPPGIQVKCFPYGYFQLREKLTIKVLFLCPSI